MSGLLADNTWGTIIFVFVVTAGAFGIAHEVKPPVVDPSADTLIANHFPRGEAGTPADRILPDDKCIFLTV